jgi:hypothetical protein
MQHDNDATGESYVWYGHIEQLEARNQNLFVYAYIKQSPTEPKDITRDLQWKLHIRGKDSGTKDWTDFPEQQVQTRKVSCKAKEPICTWF